MGTTPVHNLPYPEGSDLLIGGDDVIQALAERLEAMWAPGGVVIERAESSAACAATASVGFPGTVSLLSGWTNDSGTVLTRVGPARLWLITAEVEIISGSAGSDVAHSTVVVCINGTEFAASYDSLYLTTAAITNRQVVHRVCVSATLGDGDSVYVTAGSSGPSGSLGVVGLRIEPIGPAQ